jgi:hypothetical protein
LVVFTLPESGLNPKFKISLFPMTDKEPIVFLYAQDDLEGWWGWYCPWCKNYNVIGDDLKSQDVDTKCYDCKFGRKKNVTGQDLIPVPQVSWIEENWRRRWRGGSLHLSYFHYQRKNPTITK